MTRSALPPVRLASSLLRRLAAPLAITALGLTGCGESRPSLGPVYEVTGQVLLPDGKPLPDGHIYFDSADGLSTSHGTIAADGRFALVTGTVDGAPAGDYKVRLEPGETFVRAGASAKKPVPKLPFPRKYLDEDASGLRVTVKPAANALEPIRLR